MSLTITTIEHYWFVAQTIAHTYPIQASANIQRVYYNFFHNILLFVPNDPQVMKFHPYIERYPITPYLNGRKGLIEWTYFIYNRIRIDLDLLPIPTNELIEQYRIDSTPSKQDAGGEFSSILRRVICMIGISSLVGWGCMGG
jgi:hypothetical protein